MNILFDEDSCFYKENSSWRTISICHFSKLLKTFHHACTIIQTVIFLLYYVEEFCTYNACLICFCNILILLFWICLDYEYVIYGLCRLRHGITERKYLHVFVPILTIKLSRPVTSALSFVGQFVDQLLRPMWNNFSCRNNEL